MSYEMNHVFIGKDRELILVTEAPLKVIKQAIDLLKVAGKFEINNLTNLLNELEFRTTWDNVTAMDILDI